MSLKQWENNGWLKSEPASSNELQNLMMIVERDIKDSQESVSADWHGGAVSTVRTFYRKHQAKKNPPLQ